MKQNCRYGTNRVIEPRGSLPQSAAIVDNSSEIFSNELLINVDILNITSTAFSRLKRIANNDKQRIAEEVRRIIKEKGKFQCPETGSGGILIGTVAKIGDSHPARTHLVEGDKIATLVSLSLTPLKVDEILDVNVETDQVFVKGTAILFESAIYAKMPEDLDEKISVAVMDVAGAPGWTAKYVKAGDNVVIFGAGKAGILCLHEAKKRAGATGLVIAVDPSEKQCEVVKNLNLADAVLKLDATEPVNVMNQVEKLTKGKMADFVVNTTNVPNTEMACILSCKDDGVIYFFSMSTVFSKAALGCEGVGKAQSLLIGTGFTEGHADITFQILRENAGLLAYFKTIYN